MKLTVNGKPVSKEAVELEYQRLLKALRAQLAPKELSRRSHALQRQALDHAISRMLLLNEAQRRAIQTPPGKLTGLLMMSFKLAAAHPGFRRI